MMDGRYDAAFEFPRPSPRRIRTQPHARSAHRQARADRWGTGEGARHYHAAPAGSGRRRRTDQWAQCHSGSRPGDGVGSRPTSARQSRQLLDRIASFLDGPAAPRLPMFVYQRARAHALNGESELALQALDRAYAGGFRTTWALDLHPQPFLYIDPIDVDPAFVTLRTHPRYVSWLARINEDNSRQLAQLRARDAANPAT